MMGEAPVGKMGEVVSQYRNGEGELITVERCIKPGLYQGALLLCIYDDQTPTVAPLLLDEGTADWLWNFLATTAVKS